MKTKKIKTVAAILLGLLFINQMYGQILTYNLQESKSLTVLNIDAQGISLNSHQLGNLVRIEIDKLGIFEVIDSYDVA